MFLDRVKIFVRAGDGGDGAATFRREAHVPRAAPTAATAAAAAPSTCAWTPARRRSATSSTATISRPTAAGVARAPGATGKAGDDLILDVPPGTAVYDDATGELIADLVAVGQRRWSPAAAAAASATPTSRPRPTRPPSTPRRASPARSAGSASSCGSSPTSGSSGCRTPASRRCLAAAHRGHAQDRRLPVHDARAEPRRDGPRRWRTSAARRSPTCPGLIEGASQGAGLGHAFLRHVERTRVLVHVVDGSAAIRSGTFEVIRDELAAHDPALLEKPILVAFNKIDLPAAAEAWPAFRAARQRDGPAGRRHRRGDRPGDPRAPAARFAEILPDAAELAEPPEPAGVVVHRIESPRRRRSASSARPTARSRSGQAVERLAAQTNFDVEESAERFQRDLARLGVDAELRRVGVVPGDTVRFGEIELEWAGDAWAAERWA